MDPWILGGVFAFLGGLQALSLYDDSWLLRKIVIIAMSMTWTVVAIGIGMAYLTPLLVHPAIMALLNLWTLARGPSGGQD